MFRTCPECDTPIDPPDMVNIGVGEIPCGPQGCERCGWVERRPTAEDEAFADSLFTSPLLRPVDPAGHTPIDEPITNTRSSYEGRD